jgi:hypothetical protein
MEPLLDPEYSALEEKLLLAGRDVGMSPELKAKTLVAVGAAGAGLAVASLGSTGGLSWFAGKGWPIALSTVGVGAVTALSFFGPQESARVQLPMRVAPIVATAAPELARTEQGARSQEPPPIEESTTVVVDKEAVSPPAKRGAGFATKSAPSTARTLGDELEILSQASNALSAGNPALALTRVAQYRREFPRPRLGLEAEVLNIQALAESGQISSAEERAQRFVARHPGSPLIARLQKYIP